MPLGGRTVPEAPPLRSADIRTVGVMILERSGRAAHKHGRPFTGRSISASGTGAQQASLDTLENLNYQSMTDDSAETIIVLATV